MTYYDVVELWIKDCRYSDTKITKIRQKYIDNVAIGLDQHDKNKDHLAPNASRSTNYPNPYYDREDDDEDGYDDESEVGCGAPSSLSSTTNYYFWQDWWKFTSTGTGTLTSNAIASVMGSEWETYAYTILPSHTYDCSKMGVDGAATDSVVATGVNEQASFKVTKKSSYYKVKHFPKFEDPKVLDNYVENNKKVIEELSKESKKVLSFVTFNSPASQERVQELVDKYEINVEVVGGRAVNDNGEKVTTELDVNGKEVNLDITLEFLKKCDPSAQFKGVIYLRGTLSSKNLAALSEESDVFLADVSYESVAEKYKKELKLKENEQVRVFIPSPYWFVEK